MRQPSDYPYDASDPFGGYAGGRTRPHTGSDYTAPTGSPVYAITSGTINHVAETAWNGKCVMQSLDGFGLNAAYLHLSGYNVSDGQHVNEGDVIGWSGNSGYNSQGPHLHITISDGAAYDGLGNKTDPYAFITSNGASRGSSGGSSSSVSEYQALLNNFGYGLAVDGVRGPLTSAAVKDFQSKHGLVVDGIVGPMTMAALRRGPSSGLTVDGDFGPATKKALQSALGVTADGDFGPISTRALQGFLGVTQDGDWGRQTTSALQSFLGVTVDGDFGPQTTRALQERLNAGTFSHPAPAPTPAPAPVAPAAPTTPEVPTSTETVNPAKQDKVDPAPVAPVAPPAEAVGGINNELPKKEETVPEKTYAVTAEQYKEMQDAVANLKTDNEDDVSQYDLASVSFWNYAGERVIKTFCMTFASMLSTTGAVVVTSPGTANVFAEIGWWYILSVAGVSALTSLLVAMSSFKNIVTLGKAAKKAKK